MADLSRRQLAAATLAATAAASGAQAQAPARPVRMIVGFAAGGPADLVARDLARQMEPSLESQPVVVENQPGGTGVVAINTTARATPDGTTLLLAASGNVVLQPLVSRAPIAVDSLAPVGLVCTSPHLLVVSGQLPVRNLQEFIAYAKSKPGEVNFANAGTGGVAHLGAVLFRNAAGIEGTDVPYRGTAALTGDLMAGRVEAAFSSIPSLLPLVASGQLRALGLSAPSGAASVKDVPVIGSVLPGFEYTTWYGLYVAAATPRPAVDRLNAALRNAVRDAGFRQRMEGQGVDLHANSPEELTALMQEESAKWLRIVREAKIEID
ncbi:Bug family tripartite tricarboxylate transporter substrate binding protein [Roseococcus sp. YIM B11640]|uniref:Bug family tripartite tricarboxylate transporter substrate binding protein n=1 Tax=Roseococcus sp. YIM B11640 TaxID=3133973 RepID=UPI003C7DD807